MNDLNIIRFTLRLNENNNSSLLGKDIQVKSQEQILFVLKYEEIYMLPF